MPTDPLGRVIAEAIKKRPGRPMSLSALAEELLDDHLKNGSSMSGEDLAMLQLLTYDTDYVTVPEDR